MGVVSTIPPPEDVHAKRTSTANNHKGGNIFRRIPQQMRLCLKKGVPNIAGFNSTGGLFKGIMPGFTKLNPLPNAQW
jgi:hypothetical protein